MDNIEELKNRINQLERELEAERDAGISFARSVSHSLKNSLGLVRSFATIALRGSDSMDRSELKDSLEVVIRNSHVSLRIIEELRLLRSVQLGWSLDMEVCAIAVLWENLIKYCDDVIHFARATVGRPRVDLVVKGNKVAVDEVCLSVLTFLLKQGVRPNEIVVDDGEEESCIFYTITGKFTRNIDIEQIMAKRNKGVTRTEGHGLGLPFAHELMVMMGGGLTVDRPEQGLLRFTLRFQKI